MKNSPAKPSRNGATSIGNGEFIVYTHDKPDGERVPDIKTLANTLHLISRKRYPYGLENGGSVNDTM